VNIKFPSAVNSKDIRKWRIFDSNILAQRCALFPGTRKRQSFYEIEHQALVRLASHVYKLKVPTQWVPPPWHVFRISSYVRIRMYP
jgi:hypothetical protein